MIQQEFREEVLQVLCDYLDDIQMEKLADAVSGAFQIDEPAWLDKAKREVYSSMSQTLRKMSRLATRLDYLEKEEV